MMEFQVGKHYRTRNGVKVRCICTDIPDKGYPIALVFEDGTMAGCTAEGHYSASTVEHSLDILGEWYDLPEGFIPWFGGECPVDGATIVECAFSDGTVLKYRSNRFYWKHFDCGTNIIGYRVIEEPKKDAWEETAKMCPCYSEGDCSAMCYKCQKEDCPFVYWMRFKEKV